MINLVAVGSRSHISICKKKKSAILEKRFWDYDEMSRCHDQSFNKKSTLSDFCIIEKFSTASSRPPIMQPISGSPKVQIKGDRGTRNQ